MPDFARPKEKPPNPILQRRRAAKRIADTEFMSFIVPLLRNDPVARLGADPSVVTQMSVLTNRAGSFLPAGGKAGEFVSQHLKTARPELAGGDIVALRAGGQPYVDRGMTVVHEFAHRAFEILRRSGKLPKASPEGFVVITEDGRGVREEDLIRLMDLRLRGDKSGAYSYFERHYGLAPQRVDKLGDDRNIIAYIRKAQSLAEEGR